MTRNNVLFEYSLMIDDKDGQIALDKLEESFKNHELFLAEWQRDKNKIRVLSTVDEIHAAIDLSKFTDIQRSRIQVRLIPFV